MVYNWLKKNRTAIITVFVTLALCFWLYACESQVESLNGGGVMVTRGQLQLELENIFARAELKVLDLDRQDAFRNLIIQNGLLIVSGQPFNAFGILSGFAAIYGLAQVGSKVTKVVKTNVQKRKVTNDTT